MSNLVGIKSMVLERAYQTTVFFYEIEQAEKKGTLTTTEAKNGHTVIRFCDEDLDIAYDVNLNRYMTDEEFSTWL